MDGCIADAWSKGSGSAQDDAPLRWTFACGHVRPAVGYVEVIEILALPQGWRVQTAVTALDGVRAGAGVPTLHAALCWSIRWSHARLPYLRARRAPAGSSSGKRAVLERR